MWKVPSLEKRNTLTQRPSSPTPPGAEPPRTARRGAMRATGLNISATYMLEGQRVSLRGTVIDLSATGALMLVSKPLPSEQIIQLEFSVPKGPRIKATATVMHCKSAGEGQHAAGLSFAVSVDEELTLAQWVFEHLSPQ